MQSLIENFISMMSEIAERSDFKGHTGLHISNLYVHDNKILLGEPLFITDKK
jgi:pyrroloquinoline quinone (PQQ) biosynthesis protein C